MTYSSGTWYDQEYIIVYCLRLETIVSSIHIYHGLKSLICCFAFTCLELESCHVHSISHVIVKYGEKENVLYEVLRFMLVLTSCFPIGIDNNNSKVSCLFFLFILFFFFFSWFFGLFCCFPTLHPLDAFHRTYHCTKR